MDTDRHVMEMKQALGNFKSGRWKIETNLAKFQELLDFYIDYRNLGYPCQEDVDDIMQLFHNYEIKLHLHNELNISMHNE